MVIRTAFTDLVGCTVPIQQAAIGSLANVRLAAAVADAGGLGLVSVAGLPPDLLTNVLRDLRSRTRGATGCNFTMPFVEDDVAECVTIAAQHVRVIDFFWGEPDEALVSTVHRHGALACWQIGSVEEAAAAERAGCDFIIAQGIEAGGHVRGRIGVLPLLGRVLDAVHIPVLAAGGIADGRGLAAVLAAGAAGARIGTRFVASVEADAHPIYVQALIDASAEDTVYTDRFSVDWPNAPHRVLRSSIEAAEAFDGDIVGERTNRYTGQRFPVKRWAIGTALRTTTGAIEAMALWAGEGVGSVQALQPAGHIVPEIVAEAESLLGAWTERLK